MSADIQTIFLVIVATSFALATSIAFVGYRRQLELMPWAAGVALHGAGYLLFSLRGQIPDFLSVVVANVAISTMFAIFAAALLRFSGRQPRAWWVWSPVMLAVAAYILFLEDFHARLIIGSAIYAYQACQLACIVLKSGGHITGRGQYILATSALVIVLVMLVRIAGLLSGQFSIALITASGTLQTATFLLFLVCTMLVVIGLLLMTAERDERVVKESEARLRMLFENTSDAVMLLDAKGFFDCNPATLKIFGCPSKDVFVTKGPSDLSPATQPCGTASEVLARQHIDRAMQASSDRFEWVHKRLDNGQTFPAEVLLNAMDFHGRHVLQAVVRDITERRKYEDELEKQARLDYLTGLHNRRYFMQLAEKELARAIRYGAPLSLLMMDIDHFKQVNDSHGHKAGDVVLQKFAAVCLDTLRGVDIVGRVGGEEFAVLLPETDLAHAMEVADRLRTQVAATAVQIDQGLPLSFTISIGVTSRTALGENLDALLNEADKALYVAKNSGRNKVVPSPGQAVPDLP